MREKNKMKLTIIGRNGPFPKENEATSGYLLKTKDKTVIIDMGSGVFSRIQTIISPESVDAVFISHFHADHSADMPIFAYYLQQLEKSGSFNGKIKVYCPKSECLLYNYIKSFKYFDIINVEEETVAVGGTKFEFFKMKHPEISYGVKISDGKSVFAYTGDTNECESISKLIKNADVALMDGGLTENDYSTAAPHLSMKKCVEYGEKLAKRTVITHINPKYTEEEIYEDTGEKGKWEIAQTGKVYDF